MKREPLREREATEGDVASSPSAAAPAPIAARVLALQQSAGNAAVGRLLGQRRSGAAATIATSVERGGLGPSIPRRRDRVFKEDLLVVRADVQGMKDPSGSVVAHITAPGMTVETAGWEGDAYVWRIRAGSIGRFALAASLTGGVDKRLERTIEVVGDAADQLRAIVQAQAILTRRFGEVQQKLAHAGAMFNSAYRRHEGELKDAEAAERLDREILIGLVFAGLGGFVGGAVGGVIKPRLGDAISGRLREGITDVGKDMVKYSIRTLGRRSAATTATAGDATAPASVGQLPSGGSRRPVMADPLAFYLDLAAALEAEKVDAFSHLEAVLAHLRTLAGRSSDALFDEDPAVWASKRDILLDTISERLETNETRYYEELWGAWVRANYYSVQLTNPAAFNFGAGSAYTVQTAGWRITRLLREVAKTCGYGDLQAFLDKYGDRPAKAAEAAKRSRHPWQAK